MASSAARTQITMRSALTRRAPRSCRERFHGPPWPISNGQEECLVATARGPHSTATEHHVKAARFPVPDFRVLFTQSFVRQHIR